MGSHRVSKPRKSWLVVGGIVMAIVVAGGGSTLALMNQSEVTPISAAPSVPAPSPVRTTTEPTETPAPAFVPDTNEKPSTRANRPRTTTTTPRTTVRTSPVKCTNQRDYAMDPRSNAEINSIGAQTGKCPKPQTMSDARTIDPDSSGESQLKWLCQQGMIEEAACR